MKVHSCSAHLSNLSSFIYPGHITLLFTVFRMRQNFRDTKRQTCNSTSTEFAKCSARSMLGCHLKAADLVRKGARPKLQSWLWGWGWASNRGFYLRLVLILWIKRTFWSWWLMYLRALWTRKGRFHSILYKNRASRCNLQTEFLLTTVSRQYTFSFLVVVILPVLPHKIQERTQNIWFTLFRKNKQQLHPIFFPENGGFRSLSPGRRCSKVFIIAAAFLNFTQSRHNFKFGRYLIVILILHFTLYLKKQ